MTAVHTLLAGFFDYAGLYPPASLSLPCAAKNYLDYISSKHAWALGRFIINLDRLDELRSIAHDRLRHFKLSVIVPDTDGLAAFSREISNGMPIEAVEMKSSDPEAIECISKLIPKSITAYIEVPLDASGIAAMQSISSAGLRAKIRLGGVTAEAFPPASTVIQMLSALAKLRLPFKATAGLHHPIRSHQPLTYDPHSAKATMHGFVNLCCAAALLYYGGDLQEAEQALQETDRTAWHLDEQSLKWHHLKWTSDQLSTLLREFFTSIGSCSFEEPMHGLEALGWL